MIPVAATLRPFPITRSLPGLALALLAVIGLAITLAAPALARSAGGYPVVAGSIDNAIRLTFEYVPSTPPIVEILARPVFVENLRIETLDPAGSELVIRFDVAEGVDLDQHATLAARIDASDARGERTGPIVRRWPLRIAGSAPASQSGYRLSECCLAPEDVEVNGDGLPVRSQLVGGSPNPWRGVTRIRFGLAGGGAPVTVRVHDITGRRVCTIETPHLSAGFHQITWTGKDDAGNPLPPGIYLYTIRAGSWTATGRSLLVR